MASDTAKLRAIIAHFDDEELLREVRSRNLQSDVLEMFNDYQIESEAKTRGIKYNATDISDSELIEEMNSRALRCDFLYDIEVCLDANDISGARMALFCALNGRDDREEIRRKYREACRHRDPITNRPVIQ